MVEVPADPKILDEPEKKSFIDKYRGFKRVFWLVNAFELFERAAYFGMTAIWVLHIVDNLGKGQGYGYTTTEAGALLSTMLLVLYSTPIIAGGLAEKVGYKKILIMSFILMIVGYLSLYFLKEYWYIQGALLVWAIGAGSFKPMVSATIAHVTTDEQRNLGYQIFYWMINVGAVVSPFLIVFLFPYPNYAGAFILISIFMMINLVLCLFLMEEPTEADPDKQLSEIFARTAMVIKDVKFMAILVIFGFFFFVYSINNLIIPYHVLRFGLIDNENWVPLIAIVNPLAVVIIGPIFGTYFEKYPALQCMIMGMVVYLIGYVIVGFTLNLWIFIAGIAIFTIGEFITYPAFLSYISKIAPKEKVAVYMGYMFLSPLIGYGLGNMTNGYMYNYFGDTLHMPKVFWAIAPTICILTLFAFIWYNKHFFLKKTDAELLEEMGSAEVKSLEKGEPKTSARLMFLTTYKFAMIMTLFIPIIFFAAFAAGPDPYFPAEEDDGTVTTTVDWTGWTLEEGSMAPINDYLDEGGSYTMEGSNISVENVNTVTITLRWTDEEDLQPYNLRTYENLPDGFSLSITDPAGNSWNKKTEYNEHGSEGVNEAPIDFNATVVPFLNGTGDWEITVNMVEAGMFSTDQGPGAIGYTDTGNAFTLEVTYTYYTKE